MKTLNSIFPFAGLRGKAPGCGFFATVCFATIWRALLGCWALALLAQGAWGEALPPVKGKEFEFGFTDLYFEKVGDAESIPLNIVTALAQDAKGFIWIGTQRGLVRYDGYRFRRFVNDPADSGSLAGDWVQCLWAGPDGRVWVGTGNEGISVFDPKAERFENSRETPEQKAVLGKGRVWALLGDTKGGVWIGTDQGLMYQAATSRKLVQYRHDDKSAGSLASNQVRSLLLDRKGTLWVGTAVGLQKRAPADVGFQRVASEVGVPGSLATQKIMALFEAVDGKIWLGTRDQGAAWLTPETQQLHWVASDAAAPVPNGKEWITSITQPQPDQIWLGIAERGIKIVSAAGETRQRVLHDPAIPSSLAMDTISKFFLDRAGMVWTGTWGGGLQRHDPRTQAVKIARHGQKRPTGLSDASVRSMLEIGNGTILIGTSNNGIDIFDRKHGLVAGHRPDPSKAGALADGTIITLAQAPNGELWAGTTLAGLMLQQQEGNHWQGRNKTHGLPENQISSSLFTSRGDFFAGTVRGLAQWQPAIQRFAAIHAKDGSKVHQPVRILAEDGQGRIWLGGEQGLWVLEPGATGLQAIPHEPGRPASLGPGLVIGLLADSKGRLWVATTKGLERLLKWDGHRADFEHIDIAKLAGRAGLIGSSPLEDKLGRIWTESYVYDPQSGRAFELAKADGLDIGTTWAGSKHRTPDGLLLFGGSQGLAVVDPAQFQPWNHSPPIVASELKINGKRAPMAALDPALTLRPEQRNFSLEFSALDFSMPQRNRYRYRLQGYDSDWIEADAEHRSAHYANLWPASYTLRVQGSNRLGQWSTEELRVPVLVLPAFWQTGWFLTLLLLALGGGVYGAYRWRLALLQARMQKRAVVLQNLVDERTADILKLGEIGQELTATLDTEQAFDRVYRQVSARLDAHVFRIGVCGVSDASDAGQETITMVYDIEGGQRQPAMHYDMAERERPACWCVLERREIISPSKAGLLQYVGSILPSNRGADVETVVYLPLVVQQKVIGCLSAQSRQLDAYSKDQIEFLRVLASYTAIAVSNSTAHSGLASSLEKLEVSHRYLQEAQEQLIQAEKVAAQAEKMAALGNLVVGVAHEINTPVGIGVTAASSLHGSAIDLGDKYRKGQMKKKDLEEFVEESASASEMILVNLERAARLIQTFKKISVEQSGETKHLFNVKLTIAEAIYGLQDKLAAAGIAHRLDCPEELEFESYSGALAQIITYLLENVLLHAFAPGQTGSLSIVVVAEGNNMLLTFADDGGGVPPEVLGKIFDPFFTTKRGSGRTGLGLHIVHNLVTQAFRGNVECQSEAGKGCVFTLSLQMD